jgi:hypothetical protein
MNGGVHEGAMLQALWREAGRALPEFGLSPTSSYGDFLEFYAKFCALQQVWCVCARAILRLLPHILDGLTSEFLLQ